MNLYSIDIRIYGTAYIKAETASEAQLIANRLEKQDLIFEDDAVTLGDIKVTGLPYDHPDLPDVSLSPCFSIWGPEFDAEVELSEEDIGGNHGME
jgi:hypothetical protein